MSNKYTVEERARIRGIIKAFRLVLKLWREQGFISYACTGITAVHKRGEINYQQWLDARSYIDRALNPTKRRLRILTLEDWMREQPEYQELSGDDIYTTADELRPKMLREYIRELQGELA